MFECVGVGVGVGVVGGPCGRYSRHRSAQMSSSHEPANIVASATVARFSVALSAAPLGKGMFWSTKVGPQKTSTAAAAEA